jgi:DNA invertase Pin-like site-specific DNA recombinase
VTVLAALSEMEREQVAERTRFALDAIARSEGRGRSRFTPFGWRNADGRTENQKDDRRRLVPHPGEQAALQCLLQLREDGLGARRIAATLNQEGVENPRSGTWTVAGIVSILRRLDRWERAGVEPVAA